MVSLSDLDNHRELALEALQKIGVPSVQQLIPLLENPLISLEIVETLLALRQNLGGWLEACGTSR